MTVHVVDHVITSASLAICEENRMTWASPALQIHTDYNAAVDFVHNRIRWPAWTSPPGGRLNKKDGLTRYGDSHVKDKTS